MDLFHTTDCDGLSRLNPDMETLREVIAQLDDPDMNAADHPDVSLVHDPSGWSISLFPSGIATFENLGDQDGPPKIMRGLSRHAGLKLWVELSKGRIDQLQALNWEDT